MYDVCLPNQLQPSGFWCSGTILVWVWLLLVEGLAVVRTPEDDNELYKDLGIASVEYTLAQHCFSPHSPNL
jgi:hypothetical protein